MTEKTNADQALSRSYQDRVGVELDLYHKLTTPDARNRFFASPSITKQALAAVPISDAVPDSARALIGRVSALLLHAHLHYEFNDAASELALLYVESILRLRLNKPFDGEYVTLSRLIREAREKKLLPRRYTDTIVDAMI
jgi:hypothetical protein